jgi:D-alanyl-D-alanine carboxypeptidase (penicillin-binding protein 5/6)
MAAKRWFVKLISLALLLSALFSLPQSVFAQEAYGNVPAPRVDSPSCVVMDAVSGTVLYEKDAHTKRAPASVTKIMTLVLALEDVASGKVKLTDEAVCSENAWEMGGTEVWAEPGESMPLEEWLKAVAVGSANDGAVILAEFLSGTEEAFVARMNARAKELGMSNTTYMNSHGLDADGHETSAMDLAILSRHAVEVPHLLDYTRIYQAPFRGGKNELINFNKLVYLYQGCDGLKTGMTSKSGYCLSATASRGSDRFIVTLLGAQTPDQRMNDAWRLLDWAFANYRSIKILDQDESVARVRVLKGRKDSVDIVPKEPLAVTLTKDQKGDIQRKINLADIVAPIEKGQVLGSIDIQVDGEKALSVPLVAKESVARASFLDYALRYLKAFTIGK